MEKSDYGRSMRVEAPYRKILDLPLPDKQSRLEGAILHFLSLDEAEQIAELKRTKDEYRSIRRSRAIPLLGTSLPIRDDLAQQVIEQVAALGYDDDTLDSTILRLCLEEIESKKEPTL